MAPDRKEAVNEEVQKLLKANFIRPVDYPEWLANIVAVPKKNGKIRVCIDFTNLNKACPSDPYPLPNISDMVDATARHERLSFMDGYSGYKQIPLAKEDQEHTVFITDQGVYCYQVMPFGLKNARSDLSKASEQYVPRHDWEDSGGIHRRHSSKIQAKVFPHHRSSTSVRKTSRVSYEVKPNKVLSFGLSSGRFLGYIMTQLGIEANPEQIRAILEMPPPKTKKGIQQLTGRLAALNRFISKSSDKCRPFFQILKKATTLGGLKNVNKCWTT